MSRQVKSSLKNLKLVIILADLGADEICFQHLDEPNCILRRFGCSNSYEITSFDEIVHLLIVANTEKKFFFFWQKLEINHK